MDTLRGQDEIEADDDDYGAIEAPPAIDSDERRMHVRAYNYWVSLLGTRALPSIEDLNPEDTEDFSSNSVLLDFSMGLENPAVLYLGSALRAECGITGTIERIADVPPRSLLSRLTDHYLQIIANAAPVGFEAEFTNQRGAEIMYRGILMPFSSDDETIDFIYGVINWKEVASSDMLEQLDREVTEALSAGPAAYAAGPIWADGPSATSDFEDEDEDEAPGLTDDIFGGDFGFDEVDSPARVDGTKNGHGSLAEQAPAPADPVEATAVHFDDDYDDEGTAGVLDLSGFMAADQEDLIADVMANAEPSAGDAEADTRILSSLLSSPDVSENDEEPLARALEAARQSAREVGESEARSRASLYRAIGDAYDFALTTAAAPEAYADMLHDAGITVQERSPMTAVIKLVFGVAYEKTRVAEYALALDYAMAHTLPRGSLADTLSAHAGGLKGLVQDVRSARKAQQDEQAARPMRRLDRAVRKLGHAMPLDAAALPFGDLDLAVVIARREADGSISFVGGIGLDDKAAQKVMIAASKVI